MSGVQDETTFVVVVLTILLPMAMGIALLFAYIYGAQLRREEKERDERRQKRL